MFLGSVPFLSTFKQNKLIIYIYIQNNNNNNMILMCTVFKNKINELFA